MIYWFIISSLIYPITSGLNEVNELKHWEWHTSQLIDRACAINLGIAIGLFGVELIPILKLTALSAVTFWTIYDITLSHYGYKTQTNNFFDRYSFMKIIFFPGAICLNIF